MKTDNKIDVLGERFIEWKNVADKVDVEGGIRMQRVPETWCLRFPEGAAGRSRQSANVRLCLTTDSPFITLRWRTITQGVPGVVFCDGKQVCEFPSFPLMTEREDTFTAPTSGAHQWEVHFPWHAEIVMGSVLISESARLLENKFPPKSTMLFYGSSITQGFRASTGAKTWPWICSQLLGVECLNLGFGGVAFYERVVAEYIASRCDWDFLTLEAGTNSFGHESAAAFADTFSVFLDVIRSEHPRKPILCITSTLYLDCDGENSHVRSSKGSTFEENRQAVRAVVASRRQNDTNLFLAEGLSYVGIPELLSDAIHPNDSGMQALGEGISTAWKSHSQFRKTTGYE